MGWKQQCSPDPVECRIDFLHYQVGVSVTWGNRQWFFVDSTYPKVLVTSRLAKKSNLSRSPYKKQKMHDDDPHS